MPDLEETKGIVPVVFKGASGTKYRLVGLDIHSDGISNVLHMYARYKCSCFVYNTTVVDDFYFWKHQENINGMNVKILPGNWGDTYRKTFVMHFSLLLNSGKLVYNSEIDFLRKLERGY